MSFRGGIHNGDMHYIHEMPLSCRAASMLQGFVISVPVCLGKLPPFVDGGEGCTALYM